MRPAVFLDRDGTLTVEREGYLTEPAQMELVPGAIDAVRRARDAGFAVVLVTNQSAVGRGLLTLEGLARIHARLEELLEAGGVRLDAIYFCPHGPDHEPPCLCRKPAPGMLRQAAAELDLNLSDSFLVGDDRRDLDAAAAAGVRSVLVRTGKGRRVEQEESPVLPGHVADDISAAVDWILGQTIETGANR